MATKTSERVLYSIHTENRPNLANIMATHFECFAVFEGTGYWHGVPERSARIDFIGSALDQPAVEAVAQAIRVENAQEAVYVTETPVHLTEVWGD